MTDRNTDHFHGRHYAADHINGPIAFLNPTTRLLPVQQKANDAKHKLVSGEKPPRTPGGSSSSPSPESEAGRRQQGAAPPTTQHQQHHHHPQHHPGVYHIWRSRDNRKGRHALALTPSAAAGGDGRVSAGGHKPTNTLRATLKGLARMVLRYPVWDVSYDVAAVFTIGSVVWVCNGFFVLLPMADPGAAWPGESSWPGGWTAFIGATIFEFGSVLLMLEAVNENRSGCFGWALEEAMSHEKEDLVLRKNKSGCRHHHQIRTGLLKGKSCVELGHDDDAGAEGYVDGKGAGSGGDSEEGDSPGDKGKRTWTWWPSWYELRTHYLRDIGFLACSSQMIGATIFWIAGFTSLPQISSVLTVPVENGIYWLPQVVGGLGFIISSFFFMLETQKNWYTPSFKTLGWHVGFWNFIGAIGFTLCGALGFASSNEKCEVALTWSTFIGSWAFLLGSAIQWYESLDKYPVLVGNVSGMKEQSEELLGKAEDQT